MAPLLSAHFILCILQNFTRQKDLRRALFVQGCLKKTGLNTHFVVGDSLVCAWVGIGSICHAQRAFDSLKFRSSHSWNSLIDGYIKTGNSRGALALYPKMRQDFVYPNPYIFLMLLNACAELKDYKLCDELHDAIAGLGLFKVHVYLGNTLINIYAKCASLWKAEALFEELPKRDVVTWTAMIAGYVQHDLNEKALEFFDQMQFEGVEPNAFTISCSLKACSSIGAIDRGRALHRRIIKDGSLRTNVIAGSALIDMYAKCGSLDAAHEVLEMLFDRDVVCWTALIAGYAQHGYGKIAVDCFQLMQLEGISPNEITFASTLKACGSIRAFQKGKEIHVDICQRGLLEDYVLGGALTDMYAKCGHLDEAQIIFNKIPHPDGAAWNALIAGYAQHKQDEEALDYFGKMQINGVHPDAITYVSVLKACSNLGDTGKGKEVHNEVSKKGLLEKHAIVGNALVEMYGRFGMLAKAQEIFDMLPVHNIISWTVLISAYAEHEQGYEALSHFSRMQMEGICPDSIVFSCGLQACGGCKATNRGFQMHAQIAGNNTFLRDPLSGRGLVQMYAKLGMLSNAQESFDDSPVLQDVLSWTALISGYTEHVRCEEALDCYKRMQLEGVFPDPVTLACCLKACNSIGATERAKELHIEIERQGLLEKDHVLGNVLVDMYAKSGSLTKAQNVFDSIPFKDVVSWTALITGYAQQGHVENVLQMFEAMRREGKKPTSVTFLGVLNACSHAGLVDKGQEYFQAMVEDYGLEPSLEHHTCLIDLLGRAGQLEKAVDIMKQSPSYPHIEMWLTILGACRKWSDVDLGKEAFLHVMQMDEQETAAYIGMYNIYSDVGMSEDAKRIEEMRIKNSMKKVTRVVGMKQSHA